MPPELMVRQCQGNDGPEIRFAFNRNTRGCLEGCRKLSIPVSVNGRRLHHVEKPTYTYARSWFTNHDELFPVIRRQVVRPLPYLEWLERPLHMRTERLTDYSDWLLAQLLARQFDRKLAGDSRLLKQKVLRLSYRSFVAHGESIFDE